MKEAGEGRGKQGGTRIPRPTPPGSQRAARLSRWDSSAPYITRPPAPPAVANARVASRHNRPTFADPPYVSAPKGRVLARPSRSGPPAARE